MMEMTPGLSLLISLRTLDDVNYFYSMQTYPICTLRLRLY